jgi:PAS domain S-box-containing protein
MVPQDGSFLIRVFDSFSDPLIVYDRDYRIFMVNRALMSIYQRQSEELLGRHCYEVFHHRQERCAECHLLEVFRSGEPRVREKRIILPDGRQRYLEVHSHPVKDGSGNTILAIEQSRDISARKSLEGRLTRLFEVSRQLAAQNSLPELINGLQEIALEILPNSEPLFLMLDAEGEEFLRLEDCSPKVAEPLGRFKQRLRQSGQGEEFIQFLRDLKDPQIITQEDLHDLPAFWQLLSELYPSWFGLPIMAQQQCLGYFLLGSKVNQNYAQEDLHFFQSLFAQMAGHLHHLVLKGVRLEQFALPETEKSSHDGIIGKSKKMQEVYELIDLISRSDATVLITGENGTGKELVARAIHQQSHRHRGPFVVANCSAYSPTLLESELFGHERGAFTGAIRQRKGRIERAHGGTLFLDEIGDISPATQVLLLRFLQDHCFERVGGERAIEADVRVLAATNRDLRREVEVGRFRDDLYYRLNVISIHLPLLRERKEDIPLLALHFLKKYNLRERKHVTTFSADAMEALMDYDWPGNVRQLENAVSHAVILTQDEVIRRRHLPRFLRKEGAGSISTSLADNERHLILRVLQESNWNKHDAARRLQVSRSTLYSKIRRHGLEKHWRGSLSVHS